MTAIAVVIDASNIAWTQQGFRFAQVQAVRDAAAQRFPDGRVHAVIDGSAHGRLLDKANARTAIEDGWLTVAPGDADDEILRMADEFGARIVSHDNFVDAADRFSWLHAGQDRLYGVAYYDGRPVLRSRPLIEITPAKIEEAKRKKARKSGRLEEDDDREWRCTAAPKTCTYGGQILPRTRVRAAGRQYYCRSCQSELREEVAAAPAPPTGPATVSLLHGARVQWERLVPREGLILGRLDRRNPDVVDVTAGLPRDEARAVSGRHLRLFLDETDLPVAVHVAERSTSFVNARVDEDGLPANNRLLREVEYPLWPGDQVMLGSADVRLVIGVRSAAA